MMTKVFKSVKLLLSLFEVSLKVFQQFLSL